MVESARMTVSEALTETLQEIEATLRGGTLGVAATFLPTKETILYNAETVFPTASVIKVAIISELFTQEAEGRLDSNQTVTIQQADIVGGSGVLAQLTPGLALPLTDLATLTISVSDNTASNLCLAAVGGPETVNKRMKSTWGMTGTRIHRPIKFTLEPSDPPHTATGTPADMLKLVHLLAEGKIHSPAVSQQILDRMALVRDAEMLPRYLDINPYAIDLKASIPPYITRRKTGAVTGVRNDTGLISRGEETLAVCVYTKDTLDARWTPANRGSEAVAQVGKTLCEYFWRP
jgi:beta-lactamase class A